MTSAQRRRAGREARRRLRRPARRPGGRARSTVGEVAGLERAPISFADDGLNHRVTVGDVIDTEVEDLTPPESSQPTRYENIEHLAGPSVTVARATSSRVSGFGIEFEGKAGSSAPFAWNG